MGFFSQPSYPNPANITQTPQLTGPQQTLQNAAANFLTGQVGQPAQPYTGQLTAPITPQQTQQINQMGAFAGASAPTEAAGLGTLGSYASGAYLNDPALINALGTTAQQAEQQFAGGIQAARAPFVAAGQTGFSSPEEAALGGAAAQFATGLQSNLANQILANRQAQQGLQLTAAEQAVSQPQQIQQTALAAATLPQQTQQNALTAQYADWLRQLQGAWQAIQAPGAGNLVGGTGFQNLYPNVYGASPFQSLLQGFGTFAGLGGMPGIRNLFA